MGDLWKKGTITLVQKGELTAITPQELTYYDGREGRPAYVAVHNVIYDVTEYLLSAWQNGVHFGIQAGTDATEDFDLCHDHTMLERLNIVGKLVK